MNLELLLVSLLPLVLFVVVEIRYGLKAGVITAIVVTLAACAYFYFKLGSLDELMLTEAALIIALGLVSVRMNNDRFIKFQPTVVAVVLTLYCTYFQMAGDPVMVRLFAMSKPLLMEANPAAVRVFETARGQAFLASFSLHLIFVFFGHGLLVTWGALKLGSVGWLMTRLAIYPLMLAVSIFDYWQFATSAPI